MHADAGELRAEADERGCEQGPAEIGRGGDRHLAALRRRSVGHRRDRLLEPAQQRRDAMQQRLAFAGQPHRSRRPDEQRCAEIPLERADRAADVRLVLPQARGRLREALQLGDGPEDLERVQTRCCHAATVYGELSNC